MQSAIYVIKDVNTRVSPRQFDRVAFECASLRNVVMHRLGFTVSMKKLYSIDDVVFTRLPVAHDLWLAIKFIPKLDLVQLLGSKMTLKGIHVLAGRTEVRVR